MIIFRVFSSVVMGIMGILLIASKDIGDTRIATGIIAIYTAHLLLRDNDR